MIWRCTCISSDVLVMLIHSYPQTLSCFMQLRIYFCFHGFYSSIKMFKMNICRFCRASHILYNLLLPLADRPIAVLLLQSSSCCVQDHICIRDPALPGSRRQGVLLAAHDVCWHLLIKLQRDKTAICLCKKGRLLF